MPSANASVNTTPIQHLPQSKKDKDFHISCLESFLARSNYGASYNKNKINFDLLNGIINQEDFAYVSKPFGYSQTSLPEDVQHYPIITPAIKSLEGHYLDRPDISKVYSVNPESTNEALEYKNKLFHKVVEDIVRQARIQAYLDENPDAKLSQEEFQILQQQIVTPEEIQEKILSYRDSYEVMGNEIHNWLKAENELQHEFRKSLLNGITNGIEVYRIYDNNGQPKLRAENILEFTCDMDSTSNFIHEADWALTVKQMTAGKIIEMYNDTLTESEQKRILETMPFTNDRNNSPKFHTIIDFNYLNDSTGTNGDFQNSTLRTEVVHCVWRSYYKVGFLDYIDENGIIQTIKVTEDYKMDSTKGDLSIEWKWFPEIRECTRIGKDIYTAFGVVKDTPKNPDDPFWCPLPYTGVIHNNINSEPTSAMDLMKPYQYLYNIVFRMLQKDLASDKGKKLLAAMEHIPTSQGFDVDKWLHYINSDDVILFSNKEEGNKFSQDAHQGFRSIDLSAASAIDAKVKLLEYIEFKCKSVIGVNDQFLGQGGNRELVGTTKLQIQQSMGVIEPWFATHELGKKQALTLLINKAKDCLVRTNKKILTYVTSEMSKQVIEFDVDKLAMAHYGVFFSSSSENISKYNELKDLSRIALQAQIIDFSNIAKIINGQFTPAQIVREIQRGEKMMYERNQKNIDAQRQLDAEIAREQREIQMYQLELEKYKVDANNATDIEVAKISTFRFQDNLDANNNNVIDFQELQQTKEDNERKNNLKMLEINMKASQERLKLLQDAKLRSKELELKNKEIDTNLRIAIANKNKYD